MLDRLRALMTERFGARYPTVALSSDRPTGQQPMQLGEVDEHTEHYLALKNGEDMTKGLLTGYLGGVLGISGLLLALMFLVDGDPEWTLNSLIAAVLFFGIPFAWEMLHPLPLPTVFNRRTREVYFEFDGELYHTPWDQIEAVTYEYQMVHQNTGAMRHAPLEVLMHRFGKPEQTILVNLVIPVGRSIELNQHFWEYLRAYMNNGPWFDRHGQNSSSDDFVREQLSINQTNRRDIGSFYWREWQAHRRSTTLALFIGNLFFYPMHAIQDFVYAMAKRHARNQWPEEAAERLHPDGPTTRLIDLELERGLITLPMTEPA